MFLSPKALKTLRQIPMTNILSASRLEHHLVMLMEMDHGSNVMDGQRAASGILNFYFVGFPLKTFTSLNALSCRIKINLSGCSLYGGFVLLFLVVAT